MRVIPPPGITCSVCDSRRMIYASVPCPLSIPDCQIRHYQPTCRSCRSMMTRFDRGEFAHEQWVVVLMTASTLRFESLDERPVFDWGVGYVSILCRDGQPFP